VDNNRFGDQADRLRAERIAVRNKWRIPPDAYCVLFCGKFIPKKRPLDLVRAVERLNASLTPGTAVHLLFVGSGELGATLRRECSVKFDTEKGSSYDNCDAHRPNASFVGFLNQTKVASAYIAADLLVLPSGCGETWGLVVNEAMACGTPAVVSDQCGCAEDLVAPLSSRFVFRCGDLHSLAAAIQHTREANISQDCVRKAVDSHHLRHTINTVVELYDKRCNR
jgi:glycosyltransferase involved in cell wall biosynthesis